MSDPHLLKETLARMSMVGFQTLGWQERIATLRLFPELNIAFSTSFSYEDQAILHVLTREKIPLRVFTLDTGRLFEETRALQHVTTSTYGIPVETYAPKADDIQGYVSKYGINGFYDSIENRKECCRIRKVAPLARALKGVDIWISGLRRDHSVNRSHVQPAQWDERDQVITVYPLMDVGADEIWSFIKTHRIPTNPMHDNGFPSIGCSPCTRAVVPGEHPRSGRWWWEQGEQECGLHVVNGKLVRGKHVE